MVRDDVERGLPLLENGPGRKPARCTRARRRVDTFAWPAPPTAARSAYRCSRLMARMSSLTSGGAAPGPSSPGAGRRTFMEKTPSSHEKTVRSVGSASHAVGSRANVASRRGSRRNHRPSRAVRRTSAVVYRATESGVYGYAVAASHFTAGSRRECAVSATARSRPPGAPPTPRPSRPGWR